jgi:hypothetical protein
MGFEAFPCPGLLVFGFFFQFSTAKYMGTFALLNIIVSKWLRNSAVLESSLGNGMLPLLETWRVS